MNLVTRIAIPATLALGALSAHAAGPVNNEIGAVDFQAPAVHSRAEVRASHGQPQYILRDNQTTLVPNPAFDRGTSRSRDEVRREARQPAPVPVGFNA
jgi:hypothetical protein